jgi:hypothetical protein
LNRFQYVNVPVTNIISTPRYGPSLAANKIETGIKRFNEKNKDKIGHGYNQTMTDFWRMAIEGKWKKWKEGRKGKC